MAALQSCITSCSCFKWSCWKKWRRCLLASAVVIYGVFVLIMMPLIIYLLIQNAPQFTATFIAAFFVLLTLPVSLASILQHVLNYTNPDLQTYLCRIILTIPIFSVTSVSFPLPVFHSPGLFLYIGHSKFALSRLLG